MPSLPSCLGTYGEAVSSCACTKSGPTLKTRSLEDHAAELSAMAVLLQGTSEAAMHIACRMRSEQNDTWQYAIKCEKSLPAGPRQAPGGALAPAGAAGAHRAPSPERPCCRCLPVDGHLHHQQSCQQRALGSHLKSIALWAMRLGSKPLGNAALNRMVLPV